MMAEFRDILDKGKKPCNCPRMKMNMPMLLASTFTVLAFASPSQAGNSDWTKTPGGSVRLIIDNPQKGASEVRGAIQINLDPGWKTYWREPGDAGVPPELALTQDGNIKSSSLGFPAPHRFEDGGSKWAGYKKSVALPVVLTLTDPSKPAHLKGHAFLGICEAICIPVTAEFDIPIDNSPTDALTKTLVGDAFAALPGNASTSFGVKSAVRKDDHVKVTVQVPADQPQTDLFVAGEGGVTFGMAKLKSHEATNVVFSVPVLSGKDKKAVALNYTLVQGENAVSGKIEASE
jgi:DsbC/DsbD-like thiol-disulfide interchange protein